MVLSLSFKKALYDSSLFESAILKLSKRFDIRSRDQISWCDCYGRPSISVTQKPLTSILDVEKVLPNYQQKMSFYVIRITF